MDLQDMLSQQVLNMMGKQLGFSNGIPPQFVEMGSTILMSGLSRNVQSPQGAQSLFNALSNDHASGSNNILGSLMSFIPSALGNNSNAGILDNVFGQQLDPIITAFSNATGLEKGRAKQLLMIIAPIVLAYFANKMTQNKMNEKELAQEVTRGYQEPERDLKTKQDGGLLQQLLDKNNDGNYMDEAVGLLKGLILR